MSSCHVKRERMAHRVDHDAMRLFTRKNKVTKPLLGGRCPNQPRLADGHTVAVLAGILGLTIRDFAEIYDK